MSPDTRASQSSQPVDLARLQAVDTALSMVGAPYEYGGSSPDGFDCSGLVYYAYDAAGVTLPRTTTQLLRGSRGIALDEAREGDLLFFEITSKPDHVGIFIGNKQFVHAPSSGKHVSVGTLDDPYWRNSFVGARRL
jgi:cell wall-associated NlpC family hydrolase